MKIGLVGKHISHSYSKIIHDALNENNYKLYNIKSVEEVKNLDLDAFNVTHPYKRAIFDFVDDVDPIAKATNAINTVIKTNGKTIGYNTDYVGFQLMMEKHDIDFTNKHVVILGNGATSRTIAYFLRQQNIQSLTHLVRHKININDDLLTHQNRYKNTNIIINTTPVGMYPNTNDASLIDFKNFPQCEYAIDIIYNPYKTHFLLEAENHYIPIINGLYMLLMQAVETEKLIQKKSFSTQTINEIYHKMIQKQLNIVLIGLPFSGKSTIGSELSKSLRQPLIDTDDLIEHKAQTSISNIFKNEGENKFRQLEKDIIFSLNHQRGSIISTGGGVILDEGNMKCLKQNGLIIYINKDIDLYVDNDYPGRPLVNQKSDLLKLYKERHKLYKKYADIEYTIDENHPHHIGRIKALIYEYFNH